jgi:hypothetical protein
MSDTQIFLITTVIRWASGLGVSLPLGPRLIGIILDKLRGSIREKAPEEEQTSDPTVTEKLYIDKWLVGILERLFFTVMVAFRIPGTGAAMGLWITVKMLYN